MKSQQQNSSMSPHLSGRPSTLRSLALLAGLLLALGTFVSSSFGADGELQYIHNIDIVSLSHLDVGFTDQPSNVHEYQRRYLDIAIDLCWETRDRVPEERFHWTAESALPVAEWWQSAPADRRERLVELVKRGQIDIAGFPFNVESFADRQEWNQMLHWLPKDAWTQLRPSVGIQDDVNGLARAGAMQLLDNGIHRVFMGLNAGRGRPSVSLRPRPSGGSCRMAGRSSSIWRMGIFTPSASLDCGIGVADPLPAPMSWRSGLPAKARFLPVMNNPCA